MNFTKRFLRLFVLILPVVWVTAACTPHYESYPTTTCEGMFGPDAGCPSDAHTQTLTSDQTPIPKGG